MHHPLPSSLSPILWGLALLPGLAAEEPHREGFDTLDLASASVVEFNRWNSIQRSEGSFESQGIRWEFDATEMKDEWAIDGPGLVLRDRLRATIPGGLESLSFRYRGVYEPATIEVRLNGRKVEIKAGKIGLEGVPGRIKLGREDLPRGDLELVLQPVHWCLIDDLEWVRSPPTLRSAEAWADGSGITVQFTREHGLVSPDLVLVHEDEKTAVEIEEIRKDAIDLKVPGGLPKHGWDQFRIRLEDASVPVDQTRQLASVYRHWPAFEPRSGATPQAWVPDGTVREGWDWSLPPAVRPSPKAMVRLGFHGWKRLGEVPMPEGMTIVDELWWTWRKLEPEEGQFDFDSLREAIRQRVEAGCDGVVLRILGSRWSNQLLEGESPEHWEATWSAPRWLEGLGIPIATEVRDGEEIRTIDVTDPRYHERHLRLIRALGESGILAQEEVRGAVICSPSDSSGEEGEGYGGDDPERAARVKETMRTWAEVMGEKRDRLLWVGSVNPGSHDFMEFAQELGIGQRSGFVETYLIHAPNRHLGQRITGERYLEVDEANPFLRSGALFGDENEEYMARDGTHGVPGTFPYRYHNSMLRFLQMRRNYLYADDRGPDPEFLHYVLHAMGRTVEDSPDAWCALRESHLSRFGHEPSPGPLRNLERWIYQRDEPGFETVAVEAFPNPMRHRWLEDKAKPYQMIARKGPRIGLAVDDRFLLGPGHRVAIKVTFLDVGGGRWRITDPEGSPLAELWCGDSGELRTATFLLEAAAFPARGMDFDLVIEGVEGYEPTIAFVRLVKR